MSGTGYAYTVENTNSSVISTNIEATANTQNESGAIKSSVKVEEDNEGGKIEIEIEKENEEGEKIEFEFEREEGETSSIEVKAISQGGSASSTVGDEITVILYSASGDDDDNDDGEEKSIKKSDLINAVIKISGEGKEINIIGSKLRKELNLPEDLKIEVRGWDPVKRESMIERDELETNEDLEVFIAQTVLSDNAIESISFNFEKIKFGYKTDVKLFGFLPVTMIEEVEADISLEREEEIKVKFPWWHVFARGKPKYDDIKNKLEEEREKAEKDLLNIQNEIQKTGRLVTLLLNIMKSSHDTAESSINDTK